MEIIDNFKKNKFDVYIISGKITKDKDIYICKGGYIKQNDEGYIIFELFSETNTKNFQQHIDSLSEVAVGQLGSKQSYYSFQGKDKFGRTWEAKYLRCSFKLGALNSSVITGTIELLECSSKFKSESRLDREDKISLKLIYPYSGTFPHNETSQMKTIYGREPDQLSFNHIEKNVTVYDLEHYGKLTIVQKQNFLEVFFICNKLDVELNRNSITNTLRFILASNIDWIYSENLSQSIQVIELKPNIESSQETHLLPPIQFSDHSKDKRFEKLFKAYFKYLIGNANTRLPIFIEWVIASGYYSVENLSSTITVAVEGLCKYLNNNKKYKLNGMKLEDIYRIKVEIGKTNLSAKEKNRISGIISNFKQISVKDVLYKLKELGLIDGKLIKIWTKLRNKEAHENRVNKLKNLQISLNSINSVTVLFYNIIFLCIEYKGVYLDYSTNGWPEVEF